jgi:hypothetical protein
MVFKMLCRHDPAEDWAELHTVYPPLIPIYQGVIADQNREIGFEKYRIVAVPAELQKFVEGEWIRSTDIQPHELERITDWVDSQNARAGYERLRIVEVGT